MPIFKITVKRKFSNSRFLLEPGMTVEVVTKSASSIFSFGGRENRDLVLDAFVRKYGCHIDSSLISSSNFVAEKIG